MKYIERAYPWLLISPAILPVVIWGGFIYPYLVPKTLFFYALSLITVAAFALLVAHGREFFWARLRHPETWIPGALLVLAYVASFYGLDFYRSFWSVFVRGDGLLMLTCAVLDFYFILLYADRIFFERLLRTVAVISSFVALYGIGESFLGGGRIGGLLGNAAFFAGYLGISFFATLAASLSLSPRWRRAVLTGAVLQIVAIVLSATRGTILALGVAGVACLLYFAWRGKGRHRPWATGALITLIALGGLFFIFRSELAQVPFVPVSRIATISITETDVASRLFIWKNMIGEIEKSPWLGVGAEHIDVLFNRFYDPTQIVEQWFDRSHNAFLDYAAQYGIGGLLLYLALIATFFTAARRFHSRGEEQQALIFSLLAITYAAQNFFIFDTISSFWLLLALLAAFLPMSFEETSRVVLALPVWVRGASWLLAVTFIILIIPVSIRPAFAASTLAHAYSYQLVDVSKEINLLSKGTALLTYGDLEYGYEVYDMYANQQSNLLTGQARVDAYQSAVTILAADFNRYTYDGRTALYLAHVLSLAPEGTAVDTTLLSAALERAIRLSPKRSQPWYILANLSIVEANTHPKGSPERIAGYAAARDLFNRYIALAPTFAEPHFVLAQLLLASGDVQGASAEAAIGKANYTGDLQVARRAAGYYESVQEWADAKFFLTQVIELAPTDIASRYDLAKVMYLTGDPAAAEQIVAELRTKDPAILETDQNFLNAITAYEQSKK